MTTEMYVFLDNEVIETETWNFINLHYPIGTWGYSPYMDIWLQIIPSDLDPSKKDLQTYFPEEAPEKFKAMMLLIK